MPTRHARFLVVALAPGLLALGPQAASAAMWHETIQGDLSDSGLAPSQLMLEAGSNVITGGFGAPDLDYLTVFVPTGHSLSAIVTGLNNSPGLSVAFIGVHAGETMTVPPDATSAAGLLGWTHFGSLDGRDLLPAMRQPRAGSMGFSGLLPAGAYTFWFNEISAEPGLTYDLDFRVQPVPLPAAAWLLGSGLLLLRASTWRKITSVHARGALDEP